MTHNLARETFAVNVTQRQRSQGEFIVRQPESGPRAKRSGAYADLKLEKRTVEHKENRNTEFKTPGP
jgi:hypothetical protein